MKKYYLLIMTSLILTACSGEYNRGVKVELHKNTRENKEKTVLSFTNKTISFFDGTSTEVELQNDFGINYKITCKKQTFSQDNFLDYSVINYPVIQIIDGKANQNLEVMINQLLYEMSMLRYSKELEKEVNAFYSCDYYILFADEKYICIYYMESIGSGAGIPSNFEDAITISLETGKKVSLNDFGNTNEILKEISNYNGVIYTDTPFDEVKWKDNIDEFLEKWKENDNAEYYGYYFYNGRLGFLFDYYQTGREKIAFEFEGILNKNNNVKQEKSMINSPCNLSDMSDEINSQMTRITQIQLESWGIVNLVSVISNSNKPHPTVFLTDKDYNILYIFNSAFHSGTDITRVSVEDINGDGLKDIRLTESFLIATDVPDIEWIFYQGKNGEFHYNSSEIKQLDITSFTIREMNTIRMEENEIALEMYNQFLIGNLTVMGLDIDYITVPTGESNRRYATNYALFDSNRDGIIDLHIKSGRYYYIFTINEDELIIWKKLSPNPPYYALDNGAFISRKYGAAPMYVGYHYIIMDYLGNEIYSLSFSKYDKNKNEVYDDNDEYLFDWVNVSKKQWEALTETFLYIDESGVEQIRNEIEWIVLFEEAN